MDWNRIEGAVARNLFDTSTLFARNECDFDQAVRELR